MLNKPFWLFFRLFLIVICGFGFTFASTFNTKRPTDLPSPASTVASGDLNNDGIPDLVVGRLPQGQDIGKVSIFIGKGNGNFQPQQDVTIGFVFGISSPHISDIEIGDLNGDNNLDVVVAHNTAFAGPSFNRFAMTVLFGNGNGTFRPAEPVSLSIDNGNDFRINAVSIGDFNNDGKTDIYGAGLLNGSGFVYPIRNIDNSQYQITIPINVGEQILDIAKADFDQDGKIDLIAGVSSGNFILYGAGNMYFDRAESRDSAKGAEPKVTVADFNRDGRHDYAVVNAKTFDVRVFLNSPNGIAQLPRSYRIKPVGFSDINRALISSDFNGDGNIDFAVALFRLGKVRIYFGNGSGGFTWGDVVSTGMLPHGLASADLDSNGKLDLIAVDLGAMTTEDVTVFLNTPNPQRYYTDFDADGKSDFTIFRPSNGMWWTLFSGNNSFRNQQFGLATDIVVNGNFDGDNKTDLGVFRDGIWYIQQSGNGAFRAESWGKAGDIPVPADYDNDGLMETAVFRPSDGKWYIRNVNGMITVSNFGIAEDKPIAADYDGDGKADIAVFRPSNSTWYIYLSLTNQLNAQPFGIAGDKPIPADYDGDGKSDIAFFRPSSGIWYILQSGNNLVRSEQFGTSTDIPTPSDFSGDGKNDIAVFRPSDGIWYTKNSQNGMINGVSWGVNLDLPIR
jgi:hypothetical protein